jgi:hypothetical protein
LFNNDSGADVTNADLNDWLAALEGELAIGMQALEDALCNWQKSPDAFKGFRG